MEPTADEIPTKRVQIDGHDKTLIPQETMLEVLLWLDRFDLDGKQITARRFRSLVENKQMPLRKVEVVDYNGDMCDHSVRPEERNVVRIHLKEGERDRLAEVELKIETDEDALKAASYLSTCFVSKLYMYGHCDVLPKNAIIASPPLIGELGFRFSKFNHGNEDALSETLDGSTFRSLLLFFSTIPAWQIDDKRLKSLRLRGCNEIYVRQFHAEPEHDDEIFKVTEEGILSYCFTLDAELTAPNRRSLRITWSKITPAFFRKVVEASKVSPLTSDVEISLQNLRFEVGNLDLGVVPTHSREYDHQYVLMHNVRYNIADHGNGIRLLIHFISARGEKWEVVIRHGKKDHDEFFELQEEKTNVRLMLGV